MIKEISLSELCKNDDYAILKQKTRYENLRIKFNEVFDRLPEAFFSVPGRTEISGNHTDHNNGKVIAASINLDSIAAAGKRNDTTIRIYSEGYEEPFEINIQELNPLEDEADTTNALIRGICAGFKQKGFNIGGFDAFISSEVMMGSGLSSSASIEVLLGNVMNHFYNDAAISPVELAKIGQFAENKFFGKPCGLMDQVACAVGGIVAIDFKNNSDPKVEQIEYNFSQNNYSILVVHTGGSHFNLTSDYAAIPQEMNSVAAQFGREVCREVQFDNFMEKISSIRDEVSDRALLRAYHFYKENNRVSEQIEALKTDDFAKFLELVKESGNSSIKWLQNIYSVKNPESQNITLVLALTEEFIDKNKQGVCRIHGGGFEGTIQVFLPESLVEEYEKFISKIFKDVKISRLSIREFGAIKVN